MKPNRQTFWVLHDAELPRMHLCLRLTVKDLAVQKRDSAVHHTPEIHHVFSRRF